jgi:membrane protein
MLVYTVISLVQKVENSFNMIWHVPQMRSLSDRFSNYLSVIMVGPLLMVSAIGLSATIFSSDIMQGLIAIEPLGTVILFLSRFTPFLMVVLAFTFVYIFMPNTKVQLKYAFIGGVVAGVSWQAASILFATTVAGSAKYAAIYSSIANGIILLIWLYLNWLILLLGSSIAFYLQNPGSVAKRSTVRVSPELLENIGLALMWLVCRPFSEGKAAPQQEDLEGELRVPGEVTRRVSDKLIRGGLLSLAGGTGDKLVPAKALELITVGDILRVVRSDEDGLARRLPRVVPAEMLESGNARDDRTMAELLRKG